MLIKIWNCILRNNCYSLKTTTPQAAWGSRMTGGVSWSNAVKRFVNLFNNSWCPKGRVVGGVWPRTSHHRLTVRSSLINVTHFLTKGNIQLTFGNWVTQLDVKCEWNITYHWWCLKIYCWGFSYKYEYVKLVSIFYLVRLSAVSHYLFPLFFIYVEEKGGGITQTSTYCTVLAE